MDKNKLGVGWDANSEALLSAKRHTGELYSIKGQFSGATVLLTGASGYIGSVVLEQLLRTTNVATVYLLLRGRRGADPDDRVRALLQSSLFHLVRDDASIVSKVKAVQGDIQLPGLDLSPSDRSLLSRSVDVIIHCAADIRLEPSIQESLQANFEGTRAILELAASCTHLRALVHVSSCFVNVNRPRSSVVAEQLYPLMFGEQVVDAEDVASELMSLPASDADMRANVYMRRWRFPNTYTLGKHLTEHLVAKYQSRLQLPVAIVRPSLVSAMAGAPYPGYSGNWAGCIGAGAAMAIGLFDCLGSVASHPLGVWDIVPSDLVGSSIIAAAAAVASGVSVCISRATGSGSLHKGGRGAAAAAAPAGAGRALRGAKPGAVHASGPHCMLLRSQARPAGPYPLSVGLSDDTANSDRSGGGSSFALSDGSASEGSPLDSPKAYAAAAAHPLTQRLLERAGMQAAAAAARPLLIVHAATSSTYPLTLMEGWNYNLEFFAAHSPPFSITPGSLPRMTDGFVPSDTRVMACRAWTGWKVWVICSLLKLFGKQKEAKKLQVGFDTFCVHNNSKTDRDLTFSTLALVELERHLEPSERRGYLLVWRPMALKDGAASGGGALTGVAGDMCWRRYCHTQMAGIYAMLYGAAVPSVAAMRHAVGGSALPADALSAAHEAAEAIASGNSGTVAAKRPVPADVVSHVVAHDFVRIR